MINARVMVTVNYHIKKRVCFYVAKLSPITVFVLGICTTMKRKHDLLCRDMTSAYLCCFILSNKTPKEIVNGNEKWMRFKSYVHSLGFP